MGNNRCRCVCERICTRMCVCLQRPYSRLALMYEWLWVFVCVCAYLSSWCFWGPKVKHLQSKDICGIWGCRLKAFWGFRYGYKVQVNMSWGVLTKTEVRSYVYVCMCVFMGVHTWTQVTNLGAYVHYSSRFLPMQSSVCVGVLSQCELHLLASLGYRFGVTRPSGGETYPHTHCAVW